jgi:hypothetical protein
MPASRPLSFILAASDQGTFIVNRNDVHSAGPGQGGYGVGHELLQFGAYNATEVGNCATFLEWRREFHGDGVVMLDCGANVGTHTVALAKHMTGWGRVHAFEAQERIFYALAGNICLNNCANARATFAAVSDRDGQISVPVPDYDRPGSFGSLELAPSGNPEFIGQAIDYALNKLQAVRAISLDSLPLTRLDFIKIDVEGMEMAVLAGARGLLAQLRPYILVEYIKSDRQALEAFLTDAGYRTWQTGINLLALPEGDPCAERIVTV